jgi:hypothetical protein
MELCDVGTGFRTQRFAAEARKILEFAAAVGIGGGVRMDFAQVAVVFWANGTTGVFLDITAIQDPVATKRGETLADIAPNFRVVPGAACVINADRLVVFVGAVEEPGAVQGDFAEGYTDIFVASALSIDLARSGKGVSAVGFERIFGGNHRFMQF